MEQLISPGYFVYVMANEERTLFYTGVTGYLSRKLAQHAAGQGYEHGSNAMHKCRDLVYLESHDQAVNALQREDKIRVWNNTRIAELVSAANPEFRSLNQEVIKESISLL